MIIVSGTLRIDPADLEPAFQDLEKVYPNIGIDSYPNPQRSPLERFLPIPVSASVPRRLGILRSIENEPLGALVLAVHSASERPPGGSGGGGAFGIRQRVALARVGGKP